MSLLDSICKDIRQYLQLATFETGVMSYLHNPSV